MDAAEIAVDERVPGLRLVGSSVGEAEMPSPVLVPRVLLQERVLVIGARLGLAPVAVEHVLASPDELSRASYCAIVDRVGGDGGILAVLGGFATTRAPSPQPSDRRGALRARRDDRRGPVSLEPAVPSWSSRGTRDRSTATAGRARARGT